VGYRTSVTLVASTIFAALAVPFVASPFMSGIGGQNGV
jgi:hypothetical protein